MDFERSMVIFIHVEMNPPLAGNVGLEKVFYNNGRFGLKEFRLCDIYESLLRHR
jgi:hypothetical protein